MSPIKKSDVKNHRSTHDRNGIHLYRPASQPDATGFSGEQAEPADSDASRTVEGAEHRPSASGQENRPAKAGSHSSGVVTITDSKSARP